MPEFDNKSVQRISNVVRRVEGTPYDTTGKGGKGPRYATDTMWARITTVGTDDKDGQYEWEEVYYDDDAGDWAAPEQGRQGLFDDAGDGTPFDNYCVGVNGTTAEVDDVVLLRVLPFTSLDGDGNPQWVVRWGIISGGGSESTGQYQFMNRTMVTDNQSGWDWLRAHPIRDVADQT